MTSFSKLLFVVFLTLSFQSVSQEAIYEDESTVLYKKLIRGGFVLHGDGWGANFAKAQYKSIDKLNFWGVEIVGMKHPKEKKTRYPYNENSRYYFFGKSNSFYVIRPQLGKRVIVSDKLRKSGVEVGYSYSAGPALGFTKPIYLEIINERIIQIDPNNPNLVIIDRYITEEKFDVNQHSFVNIYGRASGFKGLSEMKFYPGVHAKFSLFFEYAPYQTAVKGIEVGAYLDAYGEQIPIMALAETENKQFFFNFFLNLFIGKKYN